MNECIGEAITLTEGELVTLLGGVGKTSLFSFEIKTEISAAETACCLNSLVRRNVLESKDDGFCITDKYASLIRSVLFSEKQVEIRSKGRLYAIIYCGEETVFVRKNSISKDKILLEKISAEGLLRKLTDEGILPSKDEDRALSRQLPKQEDILSADVRKVCEENGCTAETADGSECAAFVNIGLCSAVISRINDVYKCCVYSAQSALECLGRLLIKEGENSDNG
ncbi:MAG: hypothetical protein ACI4JA_07715 [Oscillospiraceae bacterium]